MKRMLRFWGTVGALLVMASFYGCVGTDGSLIPTTPTVPSVGFNGDGYINVVDNSEDYAKTIETTEEFKIVKGFEDAGYFSMLQKKIYYVYVKNEDDSYRIAATVEGKDFNGVGLGNTFSFKLINNGGTKLQVTGLDSIFANGQNSINALSLAYQAAKEAYDTGNYFAPLKYSDILKDSYTFNLIGENNQLAGYFMGENSLESLSFQFKNSSNVVVGKTSTIRRWLPITYGSFENTQRIFTPDEYSFRDFISVAGIGDKGDGYKITREEMGEVAISPYEAILMVVALDNINGLMDKISLSSVLQ